MARTVGTQIQSSSDAKQPGVNVSVPTTAGGIQLVAANNARALLILNNQDPTNPVFLSFGGTPVTQGIRLAAGQVLTLSAYTGAVSAIATGAAVAVGVAEI